MVRVTRDDALIARLSRAIAGSDLDVACVYLYGSRARGNERSDSDIDLAVLFRDVQPARLVSPLSGLAESVERATGLTADVIDMEHAPVDLIHRILRDGHLIADYAPARRIAFEVNARNQYFDLLPYLQEYRKGTAA
ncbi:nucleotidyltransferase domain-containing protein [Aquisalimonas sp.]|uniref:type VII toxin-antitoxin system MntA family adenylyltransferase antitoxin n=1 Tax=unclassified Aquisalimonas TaxID=2644645 RepID=UPI0025C205CD|nr:nucleotidyltransferase domain-containing protein [Aquisalimonas sp.]